MSLWAMQKWAERKHNPKANQYITHIFSFVKTVGKLQVGELWGLEEQY